MEHSVPSPPTEAEVVAAERAQAAVEREERARRRMRQTVRDMVLSLLVVGALVMVIAQPWRQNAVQTPERTVDWQPVAQAFADSVDWPVLAPRGLAESWQATSARITPTVDGRVAMHVGWITASEQYAALEQSDTADTGYVRDATADGQPTGTPYQAAGRQWQRLESSDGADRSLVARAPAADGKANAITYVVTGSASWPELEQLVGTLTVLRPAPSPSAA